MSKMHPNCGESIDESDGFLADLMMGIVTSALHEGVATGICKWKSELHDLSLKLKEIECCFSEGLLHNEGVVTSTAIHIQRSINALSSSRLVALDSFASHFHFISSADSSDDAAGEVEERTDSDGHHQKTFSPLHSKNTAEAVNCFARETGSAVDFLSDNAVFLVRARPLHIACTYPFFSAEFIELLLKAGANPRLRAVRERSRCGRCRSQMYFSSSSRSDSFGTQAHKDGSAPTLTYCLCRNATPAVNSSKNVWEEAADPSLRLVLCPSDGHSRCTCAQDQVSENKKRQVKNKIAATSVAPTKSSFCQHIYPMYMYLPSTYPIHCLVDRFVREILSIGVASSTLFHLSEEKHKIHVGVVASAREHRKDLEIRLNEKSFIELVEALEKAARTAEEKAPPPQQPSSKGIDSSSSSSAPLLRCLWCPISILSTLNESKESLSTALISQMLHYTSFHEKRNQTRDEEQKRKEEEERQQKDTMRKWWSVLLPITALQYLIRREAEEYRGNCRAQRLRRRAVRARAEEEQRERSRNAHQYMFECERPLPLFSELNESSSPLVSVLKRILDGTLDPSDVIRFIPHSSPPHPSPSIGFSPEVTAHSRHSNPLTTIIDFFTDVLGVDVDQSDGGGLDGGAAARTALYLLCEHCRLSPVSFWKRSLFPAGASHPYHARGWDAEAEEAVEHLLLVSGANPSVASCGSVHVHVGGLLPLQAFIRAARKGSDETAHSHPRYARSRRRRRRRRRRFRGEQLTDGNELPSSTSGGFAENYNESYFEQLPVDLRRSSSFPLSDFRSKRDARLLQMIKLFVMAGADLRASDGSGQSALYLTACYCTPFVISNVLKLIKCPPTTTAHTPATCKTDTLNLLHCARKDPNRDFSADPTYGIITLHKIPPVFVPCVGLCARVGLFPIFTSPLSGRLIGEFFDNVEDTCLFTVDYKRRSAMSEISRIADPVSDLRAQMLRRKEVEKMALERTRAFVRSRRRDLESGTQREIFAEEEGEFARPPRRVSGASGDELCGLSLSRELFFRFVDHGGVLNLELFFKFLMPERRYCGPLVSSPHPHLLPFVQLLLDTSAVEPAVIFKALRGLLDSYNRYHLLQGTREREVMVLLKSNWLDYDPLLRPF